MNNRDITYNLITPFVYITAIEEIAPILCKRLPQSANVYCMAVLSSRFVSPTEMAFFILDVPVENPDCQTRENSCWIVGSYFREDQGVKYSISAPLDTTTVPDFVKSAFCNSGLIDWKAKCNFSAIDRNISKFLWDITVCEKGNVATICPTYFYYMDITDAMKIVYDESLVKLGSDFELRCLNTEAGVEFFCSTWNYAQKNTEMAVRKILEKLESGGIIVDKKIVCGVNLNGSGLIGMLHTRPEYRNKGLAMLTMKYIIKKLASQGVLPCCAVDMQNEEARTFQEKLGMKFSHVVDFIRNDP